ncbi:MAG TPA: SRPBCC domain-containing protein [Thermoanaerobaculia bacterium]|nr:SRPBCC domain-containing protein [Thermoanaerobaculia bacterium]
MAGKRIEKSVEIHATAGEVWEALSNAEELKRWFPLDARVRPGEGGALWLSWGEGSDWETPIEVWQPGKHLRTVDTTAVEGGEPRRVAVDYLIEAQGGGTTVLRLVHSGFANDTWDDELDSMGAGWAAFLAHLKHYLEHHRGQARTLAYVRHEPVELPRREVFMRTTAALGIAEPEGLQPGMRLSAVTREGDRFEGFVKVAAPPINISGSVENWNDGFLMIEIEPGRTRCRPAIWLSLYGKARGEAESVQQRLRKLLQDEFPSTER